MKKFITSIVSRSFHRDTPIQGINNHMDGCITLNQENKAIVAKRYDEEDVSKSI